ncbi:MAG: hypothetical protein HPY69_06820 [Armatimonadetes bacterium]|nr:hypothetical protein [Armatimonadota bacterium]
MARLAVVTLLAALVVATPVLAQNQPPPPPGGGGFGMEGPMPGMPGPGMPGRPGMLPGFGPMTPPTPVMLVVPDRFLYVIYNGVLFQFDANTLELLKQVPLMSPVLAPGMNPPGVGGGWGVPMGGGGVAPAPPPAPQNP